MLIFLKKYDLRSIRYKFILIYLLNIADIIFTLVLLKTGQFIEVNIMMDKMVHNAQISLVVKIVIPLLLLWILSKRISNASQEQLSKANIIVCLCLGLYFLINISHVCWTLLYAVTLFLNT